MTQQSTFTRRRFLELSGAVAASSMLPVSGAAVEDGSDARALNDALERLLSAHAKQMQLHLRPELQAESFRVLGVPGKIAIEGSTRPAVMMGVNWYLKFVAGVSVSWNGDSLDRLPANLPAPAAPIERRAFVAHRFALNDTNNGYTGPYWRWEQWEPFIDVLALHGIDEVLVYTGAEAVYQETFRKFGITDEALRKWFPTPAHQPWWVLENISGWVGPSVSQHVIDSRRELGARIARRLRELGMTPVLPGYFGMVPDGFAEKHSDARVIPQGNWQGIKRPDWLDPTCGLFAEVAATYYDAQQRLLGPSSMFKIDPLHEGGTAGGVNLGDAAAAIEAQLQRAHPGATWAILGWLHNPKRQVLDGIKDKGHILIVDGEADRYAYQDREVEWNNTPYAFGTIWNFGGHTTIGAEASVWAERYFKQLNKPDSKLNGIAIMPEASCNNPAAFALFTELAWMRERPDLSRWFAKWAEYRYGGRDENAGRAWEIIGRTAYDLHDPQWSEAQDSLFSAQPDLTAKSAASWSPKEPQYDLAQFQGAIGSLLQVNPHLRASSAYRYDLVDVARQTISNRSRVLLPHIQEAYIAKDAEKFHRLTEQWLDTITLLNRVVGTEKSFLLGIWLQSARAAGVTAAERDQFEFDARSLLVEWGPPAAADSGVHDYANREWNGLLEFYRERWALYYSSLATALETGKPAEAIDWFTFDQNWAKQTNRYPAAPEGDAYAVVSEAMSSSAGAISS